MYWVARRSLSNALCRSGLVGRSSCQVPIFLCSMSELTCRIWQRYTLLSLTFNPFNPELNPICYLLALLAHLFLHVSRIRVKALYLLYVSFYSWNFVRLFLWEFIISTAGILRDRRIVSFTEILKVLREPIWQETTSKRDTTYPQEGLKLYASKGKAIPLRAWTGPEGSRRLRSQNI